MTKILDCTIRDGGHLNGWNFSEDCVKSLFNAAVKSGVDFFEIGYRHKYPKNEWGNFARCEDYFLFSLVERDKNCKLSVMIDAGKSDINDFKKCRHDLTPVSFVRVSAYPDKLQTAFELCDRLMEKGYGVFLNLMAISEFCSDKFIEFEKYSNKKFLESVYFADSFGSLYPNDIEKFFRILTDCGTEKVSFHSHNNLQLAFANTLKAIELNFYSVDAAAYGMGRGAGNLPMELLLGFLSKKYSEKFNPVFYMEVAEKCLTDFQKNIPWGYSIPYAISGLKNVHPNYMEEFSHRNFSTAKMLELSEKIREKHIVSFDKNIINSLIK